MNDKSIIQKGIIYVRVSSDEQVLGTSLDTQEQECIRYCETKGIRVIRVFREEGASAKSADRKQFLRAIDYCREKNKREGIDAFVVHKCDRFARNVEDHYSVRRKLLDYGTQLHSVTEPIDDSPQGKVFEAMLSAFAEFDNSIRRQRSIDGMSARINEGICPWRTPLGYESLQASRKGLKKDKPDEPHPDIFPIIQRGLKKLAKGHYTYISQLKNDLDGWGLADFRGRKTSRQLVNSIVNKYLPYYAGILHNPFTNQKVKGKHVAMITTDEYERIRYFMAERRTQPIAKITFREEFRLRQFVCCNGCGKGFTGSFSKGRKKRYAYYHCGNRKCSDYGKTISALKLEASFEKMIHTIVPTKKFWNGFKENVMKDWENERMDYKEGMELHDKRLVNLKKQKERLSDGYLKGFFTEEEYLGRKDRIENEMVGEKISKSEYSIDEINISLLLKMAERYSESILYMWRDLLRTDQRKIFMDFVFDGPILYQKETDCWNQKTNEIFSIYKENPEKCSSFFVKSSIVGLSLHRWNRIIQNLRVLEKLDTEFISSLETSPLSKAA